MIYNLVVDKMPESKKVGIGILERECQAFCVSFLKKYLGEGLSPIYTINHFNELTC